MKIECDHHLKEVRIDSDTGCVLSTNPVADDDHGDHGKHEDKNSHGRSPAVNETRRTTSGNNEH
ncbi:MULTISPECIES: hypothetical protein [Streptomyces violaceusniger group]|uniref:hypothetical protein n=1 Tax=Streptomyces violaceusniger group TaxID=2839105 RepID=UPI00142D9FAF|nr:MULTISPECIES: hypothetical protein [Streptomyces violaceusniger group]